MKTISEKLQAGEKTFTAREVLKDQITSLRLRMVDVFENIPECAIKNTIEAWRDDLQAIEDVFPSEEPKGIDWETPARMLMRDEHKIIAIKLCRSVTGIGLREAKEACEML